MNLLVLSDTHGSVTAWTRVTELFPSPDAIIHAGDVLYHGPRNPLPEGYKPQDLVEMIKASTVPVHIARGNCDAEVDSMVLESEMPDTLFVELEGLTILVNHGHNLTDVLLLDLARQNGAKLIITGHTHIPRLDKVGEVIFLNPGSTTLPKGGYPPSIAQISSEGISIINLGDQSTIKRLDF